MGNTLNAGFKKILFPAPSPPHYTLDSHREYLFWLPAVQDSVQMPSIPCMLYSPSHEATLFMIWCHGNAGDIGCMHRIATTLSEELRAHILIFEYPSYGLLKGSIEPNRETINNHAERAYSFVRDTLKYPTDRIIIYGHSIGSGPACFLASTKAIGGLILESPYTSISNLIEERIYFSPEFLTSYWDNLTAIRGIKYPTLFIHGQRDKLIPSEHSQRLYDSMINLKSKKLVFLPEYGHSTIPDGTILTHVKEFINEYVPPANKPLPPIEIHPTLRTRSQSFQVNDSMTASSNV